MKLRYKVIILLLVFAAALFIFSGGIRRTFFLTGAQTVAMSAPSLPTVTIGNEDGEFNRIYGYVSPMDVMTLRETITPLKQDKTFTVFIHEREDLVRKLKYEIFADDGHKVEEGSLTVLDPGTETKNVRIELSETMRTGQEYAARITLITNRSKRIYYYTRLKMYEDGHIGEKLDFVTYFHDTLLSGSETERKSLTKYLETSKSADISSYAHLDITSNVDMLCWGELDPEVIWEEVPVINEFYDNMASITLRSLVGVKTEFGTEQFVVEEKFRFSYSPLRVYLYNYDRSMEAVFDVSHTSIMKDEFKLGITSDTEAPTGSSPSGNYAAFVYGRELYEYDTKKNEMVRVFSTRKGDGAIEDGAAEDWVSEPENEHHADHEVRLININDTGDIDFVVFGYMDRGEYEGRVGIILYRYVAADYRIEERMYIPISVPYGVLAAELSDIMYLSAANVFYFGMNGCIYGYDLLTGELKTIASGVPNGNMVACPEKGYLCWQEEKDPLISRRLRVLDLETGETRSIDSTGDSCIRLLGRIDDNIVYSEAAPDDFAIAPDGSRSLPSYRLLIETGDGRILKEYSQDGKYIEGITIDGSMMTISLLTRPELFVNEYVPAGTDSIMDRADAATPPVGISKRVTDRTLTEYYVYLPDSVDITQVPTGKESMNTVINFDTTVRIPENGELKSTYYACSFGRIILATGDVAEAVRTADAAVGTVYRGDGKVIWERGVKSARNHIGGLVTYSSSDTMTTVQAVMKSLLRYKNIETDTRDYRSSSSTITDYLQKEMVSTPLDLKGVTLDEVLYYVYKDRPVIAIGHGGNGYLLTGYDQTTVTVYDPAHDRETQLELAEAAAMFEESGNIFISFID